ncbi:protein transport protein sec24 [Hordeum vulgare]|nr:protein transport protein sec24 [Hordeum vulgare]
MASAPDAFSSTNLGSQGKQDEELGDFFEKLDLHEEEFNDVIVEEEALDLADEITWLALARVQTYKNFSQAAFFKDIRAAWNTAKPVRFRPIGANQFVIQAQCLGDWDRIMSHGPWLFRNMAVIFAPYDGYSEATDVLMVHMPIWLQIHKLPDGSRAIGFRVALTNLFETPPAAKVSTCKSVSPLDRELKDIASSPVKKNPPLAMEVDKSARKRLLVEQDEVVEPDQGGKLLLITDGKDMANLESPSTSSDSKRAKKDDAQTDSDNLSVGSQVCDREQESSFHALLACPHTAALWDAMRLYWPLPDRSLINWTCKEWLLQLLEESHVSVRSRIIMVLWRSWYVRNEILHGKDPPPQDVSCSFLQSYHSTYSQISSSVEDIIKGKARVAPDLIPPPPANRYQAGAGMILRTATGEVIFAAYRKLFHCNDVLEAELQAIREGIKLATERSDATIMLQSDCVAAINALTDASLDNSAYGHMIREIKFLLSDRVFILVKVSREQNRVADCLANYGRCGDSTACWLGHPPPFASDLVAEDCNSVIKE